MFWILSTFELGNQAQIGHYTEGLLSERMWKSFLPGMICPPRDIWQFWRCFLLSKLRGNECQWHLVDEAMDTTKHSTMHRATHCKKNCPAPNARNAQLRSPAAEPLSFFRKEPLHICLFDLLEKKASGLCRLHSFEKRRNYPMYKLHVNFFV